MENLHSLVRTIGTLIEFLGVFIIVAGCLSATLWFLLNAKRVGLLDAYREFRHIFGRAIILGLDFLIAGDIIRTVIVSHTMTSVLVLAMIVIIRAFLSMTMELGIEGRLPWKLPPDKSDS